MDNNESQDAPVLLNKFYTVREIANIVGWPLKKMQSLTDHIPGIKDKKKLMDGHFFFDRETVSEILEKVKIKEDDKSKREEVNKKRDIFKSKAKDSSVPDTASQPGSNERQAILDRKSKVDDFNVTPSKTDHAAPKPSKSPKDYAFEEQRRGRTIQPCPAHTGKYCPKATSCPWWVEKVRGSDQGACSVKIIALSLDEIAFGEEE